MGLAEQQALLARLYTEESTRAEFLGSPEAVAERFGLSPDETRSLHEQILGQISIFSQSLLIKRTGHVRELLPRTVVALTKARFDACFGEYASQALPSGARKHHDDAISFVDALLRGRISVGRLDSWVRDVARFEAAVLEASRPGPLLTLRAFRHRPQLSLPWPMGWSIAIWLRWSRRGRLRFFRFPRSADA